MVSGRLLGGNVVCVGVSASITGGEIVFRKSFLGDLRLCWQ